MPSPFPIEIEVTPEPGVNVMKRHGLLVPAFGKLNCRGDLARCLCFRICMGRAEVASATGLTLDGVLWHGTRVVDDTRCFRHVVAPRGCM